MSEPRELHNIESDFLLHIGTVSSVYTLLGVISSNEGNLDSVPAPEVVATVTISGGYAAQKAQEAFYELMERCDQTTGKTEV